MAAEMSISFVLRALVSCTESGMMEKVMLLTLCFDVVRTRLSSVCQ